RGRDERGPWTRARDVAPMAPRDQDLALASARRLARRSRRSSNSSTAFPFAEVLGLFASGGGAGLGTTAFAGVTGGGGVPPQPLMMDSTATRNEDAGTSTARAQHDRGWVGPSIIT